MRPLLLASFALAALPLVAGETQPPPPPAPVDSPLVAAAKASTAKKRKATIVITNDNLTKSGGHITTTASQAPLPPLPAPPNEAQLIAEKARKEAEAKGATERAAAAHKAKEERAATTSKVIEATEGSGGMALYDDPAMSEHLAEEAAKAKAKDDAAQPKKPPM